MERKEIGASVRTVVEYACLSGSLTPGAQLSRMREGTLGHKARQQAVQDAQAEVTVRARVEGEVAILTVSGRIDLLYAREGVPVIEEIKLAPAGDTPEAAERVHRAQAVCYAYMLRERQAIVRVLYVTRDGEEVAAFEETLSEEMLRAEFSAFVAPYLRMAEDRIRWQALRDASIQALAFPFGGYRAGQREMAVHAYWAIKQRKRLFAEAPTGIGKTAAALFPALKALGEGRTGQIFYLTARTTGRENATAAIERMRGGGLRLRALSLTAKEKICPYKEPSGWRCDMLRCPRAEGFFDRLHEALSEMRLMDDWSREALERVAEAHTLCPFEFGLSLCEEADAVVCDYNYAFDPGARIRRIFLFTTNVTLLVDEAHNLPERAREMLSAEIDGSALRDTRRTVGKALGRKTPLYEALSAMIRWVETLPEGASPERPEALGPLLEKAMDAALTAMHALPLPELTRMLAAAAGALERFDERYTVLARRSGKQAHVTLFCLDPAPYLQEVTRKLRGCVFLSATLTPLFAWRDFLGGEEEDGLLSLPSPFPEENLLVLRRPISTRYHARERTAALVAESIAAACARPGNYLACFPSYAYLNRVREALEALGGEITLHVQRSRMTEAERDEFLNAFAPRERGVLLGMVVMGGAFGEGVDLPGERLSGVIIVGVGLPQICTERELLRAHFGPDNGFAYAYRYPGMNKVLQAVGRVIRTETDRGVALLIDDRFSFSEYAALMPSWWGQAEVMGDARAVRERVRAFWELKFL